MRIIVHIWPISCNETVLENYAFLVYVYYTHPGYQTSICGKNRAYYIRIFTVIIGQPGVWSAGDRLIIVVCVCPRSLAQPQYDTIPRELTVQALISARGRLSQHPRIPSYYCTYARYSGHTKRRRDSTGTVGHRAKGWRPVVCSVVDNGVGNQGTRWDSMG